MTGDWWVHTCRDCSHVWWSQAFVCACPACDSTDNVHTTTPR